MDPIGTPLALQLGMQSLSIPVPAPSSAHPGPREDAPTTTRRDESFAERLQERSPKERAPASGSNKAEKSHKPDRPNTDSVREKAPAHAAKTHAPKTTAPKAPEDTPIVEGGDIPVPIDVPTITPGSTLAEALLALVGTTSAAINPAQPTATDQDPLLAALATLLGELPDAQAVPTSSTTVQAVATNLQPVESAPEVVPSLLALLGTHSESTPGESDGDADPLALLTASAAMTSTGAAPKTAATTTTDAAMAAGLAQTQATAVPTGMQASAGDLGDQAAQQAPAPVLPATPTTAATDEEVPFTIAEPRAAGEATVAKPAAAPVAKPAPEAGNPMERAVANQVSRALIRESADGSRMISLRLTPPELGTVRIDIVERAGVMTARLHAEDAGVRVALERYLPQLRQDLLSHNAPVRELQLADAWAGDLTRQHQGDQQGRTGNRRGSRSSFNLDGVAAAPVGATAPTMNASTITADSVDARA